MSRRDALERTVFGVVYLPLYYLVLYPVVFFVSVVLTAIGLLWTILTGRDVETKPRLTSGAWESISQPVTWVFSGEQRDKPRWIP